MVRLETNSTRSRDHEAAAMSRTWPCFDVEVCIWHRADGTRMAIYLPCTSCWQRLKHSLSFVPLSSFGTALSCGARATMLTCPNQFERSSWFTAAISAARAITTRRTVTDGTRLADVDRSSPLLVESTSGEHRSRFEQQWSPGTPVTKA